MRRSGVVGVGGAPVGEGAGRLLILILSRPFQLLLHLVSERWPPAGEERPEEAVPDEQRQRDKDARDAHHGDGLDKMVW